MSFLIAIIIGGVIGWLASIILKTNAQMGLVTNIVVGVVGSLLGHWAAGALGILRAGSCWRCYVRRSPDASRLRPAVALEKMVDPGAGSLERSVGRRNVREPGRSRSRIMAGASWR